MIALLLAIAVQPAFAKRGRAPAEPAVEAAAPAPAPAPATGLIPWTAAESMDRLSRAEAKADFFPLSNHFESQQNRALCGPTSSVIVLNTLRAESPTAKPVDTTAFPEAFRKGLPPGMSPDFERYSQRTFFDERFTKVKSIETFYGEPDASGRRDPGLQLRQLHAILLEHGLDATIQVVADDTTTDAVRAELRENLARGGDYVLINYFRPALGQTGGGHISPLGAYDAATDSFLVLDVNPNGQPWVWVPTEMLVGAMRTRDTAENRGYLLIREGA